ncbi:MAG: PEP-CTERM sorting domain-containing protein [Colwellia sp.]
MKFLKCMKITVILVFLFAFQANANLITIDIDNSYPELGDNIEVSLWADFTDSVDTFNFDFIFDTDKFALVVDSVSTDLPNDGWDYFFELGSNDTGVGISFLSFADYISGEFLLASFELTSLQNGISEFTVATVEFYDSWDDGSSQYAPVVADSVSVSVPEPTTLAIFSLAMFGLMSGRFKKN